MRWKFAGKGSAGVSYREFDSQDEANDAIAGAKSGFPDLYERFELLPKSRRGKPYFQVRGFFEQSKRSQFGEWRML